MKIRVLIVGLMLALVGAASAHSVTVGADYSGGLGVTAEVAYETEGAALLFGVAVNPADFDTEVSVGVQTARFSVDGADFSVVLRGHLPVYEAGELVVGQVAVSAGLQMALTGNTGLVTPVVEVGVREDLTMDAFSGFPGLYLRAGLSLGF